MATSIAVTDDKTSVAEVEIAKQEPAPVRSTVAHYEPVTEEEKALDRRVNLKFDLCVIVFLSLGFIVSLLRAVSPASPYPLTYRAILAFGH